MDAESPKKTAARSVLSKQESSHRYEVSHLVDDDQSKLEGSAAFSEEQEAMDTKLLWKLDVLLIPIIAMLYLLVFIDRSAVLAHAV